MPKDAPATARFPIMIDLALFLSGLVAGWFIYPAPIYPAGSRPKPSLSELRSEQPFRSAKQLLSTLHTLLRIDDPQALEEAVAELPTRELPSLLVLLMDRGSFDGIPRGDWPLLRALLWGWHTRDSAQAMAWARAWENPSTRLPIMEVLLSAEATVDPIRAITLSHEYLVDGASFPVFPDSVYQEALRRSPRVYLICLKQSVHSEEIYRAQVMDFPPDFDFSRFARAFSKHVHGLPDGVFQAVVPENLPVEWAARDPVAAYHWTLENPGAVSNNALKRLSGMVAELPAGDISAFLLRVRESEGTRSEDIQRGLIAILDANPDPEVLSRYLASFEARKERDKQLVGLFRQSLLGTQRPERRLQRLILHRIPAVERPRFLLEVAASRDANRDDLPVSDVTKAYIKREMASLGHKPSKIDSVLKHF